MERIRQPHHLGNVVADESPGRELVGEMAVWNCSTFGIRNLNDLTTDYIPQTRELRQVRFWVVCVPVFGAREGRHMAGTYGEYVGREGGGLAKLVRLGTCSNRDTRSARHVVGEGALRGRSPRTREGRIGPTAQNCRGQGTGVRGQRGQAQGLPLTVMCGRGEVYIVSRGRYCRASARWGVSISSWPARSAMVRASLSMRW